MPVAFQLLILVTKKINAKNSYKKTTLRVKNYLIIHTGTNDAPSSTSREIQDNLLKLKALVNEKLPQCKVWLSTPTLRTDNGKATLTVSQLSKTDILVEKVYI